MPTVTRDPLSEPGIPRPNQAEYRETPISYRGIQRTKQKHYQILMIGLIINFEIWKIYILQSLCVSFYQDLWNGYPRQWD